MTVSPLYHGKPEDMRSPQEMASYAVLEQLNIPFDRIDHDAADTMEDCLPISAALGTETCICKNLLLTTRNRSAFYLLCIRQDKMFSTKDFSKQVGSSRLSFAQPADLEELLGCPVGSASILGLMNDKEHRVILALERSVAESEWFGCHPCRNTSSLRMKTKDILEKFLPYAGYTPVIVDL